MDMSRLFVKPEDTFKLTVLYTKVGQLKVAKEADVPPQEIDNWEKFEIDFAVPDFGTAKGIMRNSMSFDGTNQVLNFGAFNNAMLATLAKGWNLKDTEGQPLKFDLVKLNELRPDIVQAFIELLHEKLTAEGIYQAILQS